MSGNLTNLGYSSQTKNLYVSNIYNDEAGTVKVNLPVAFVDNTIQKILFDTSGNLDTLGALKLYSGTDLGTVFTSTSRYSVQLNSSNSFEIFDNVANDWRIRINAITGTTSFNPELIEAAASKILVIQNSANADFQIPILTTTHTGAGNYALKVDPNTTILTYNTNSHTLKPININLSGTFADSSGSVGTSGQFLSSTVTGTSWKTQPASSFINTTDASNNNASYFPVFVDSSGNQVNKTPYTSSSINYNPYLSTLTVPNISSSGTHYVGVLEATSGIGILNSAFLELNSSTLKRWLINCTADPTNNLQFSYYNGSFAVSYATLGVGGTFSTTNLSATTLVSAPTMTATGTIQGATLQATSQLKTFDTGSGLTANFTYITRASGITYIGSTVSGTPLNQLTIDVNRIEFITGGGRYDQTDNAVANQQGICFFSAGILYQQNFVAGVLNNVYYGNHANFAIVGNLFAASYSISCETRKQNIEDLCPCYSADFITKLKPKKYQYKKLYDASGNETTRPDIDRKTCFGFLAQDVKADICGCEDLGIHVEGDGDKFPQALSYMEIIAPLVKVVQDLMNTVKEQNERIKVLELKVNG